MFGRGLAVYRGWGLFYIWRHWRVSPELIESAKIDRAGRLQIIRHVNLPCILPTIIIMFIMSTGSILTVGFGEDISAPE